LLQPLSKEMGEVFEEFKSASGSLVEGVLKEAPKKFNRYVRKTLDMEQHRADYAEWYDELEEFRKGNPEYPSFEELYGKVVKRRKRKERPASNVEEDEVDVDVEVTVDKMDIEMEKEQ
jgi:hypothetical protein